MKRVTNLGVKKWILPGDVLRPGGTVAISEDSWRLALDLNKALRVAVGTEVVVEEEALPALPPVLLPEPEPDYIEPAAEQPAPEPAPVVDAPRGKRGRR